MDSLKREPFIQDKRKFIYAISGLILFIILVIPFPHSYTLWEWMLKTLSIPTRFKIGNGSTLILTGLPILILFIVCLRQLYRSLGKGSISICLIAAMVAYWLPSQLVIAYQSTFASGIYTLDVKEPRASCTVDVNDHIGTGHCNVLIENYGSSPVQANITLKMSYDAALGWPSLQTIDLGEQRIIPGYQELHIPISIPDDSDRGYSSIGVGELEVMISDGKHQREFTSKW